MFPTCECAHCIASRLEKLKADTDDAAAARVRGMVAAAVVPAPSIAAAVRSYEPPTTPLTLNDYQGAALRTAKTPGSQRSAESYLAVFALGLTGESGEVADLIKKHLGHGHALEKEKLCKELGDVLWYIATLAHEVGLTLDDVARANVEKLRARYPKGFDPKRSQNRPAGDT